MPTADDPVVAPATVDSEFTEFVHSAGTGLYRSALLLTGDAHLAEDLVQDALARTYRSWRRLHAAGNATAYTRKTMYHLQVSRWRRRRVAETLTDATVEVAAAGPDHALRVTVRQALLRLTRSQRAVIVARYFDDLSEVETARLLGISKSSVHSRTSRALARLAALAPELKGELS